MLIDPTLCAYPPANVTLLRDGEATQATIRQALADLAAQTNDDATVLIYLSCHGSQITSGPYAGEYLLPVDTQYSSDQLLAASSLAGSEFATALQAILAHKLLVILDCCHASGIGTLKDASTAQVKTGLSTAYYDRLISGQGRAILVSSDANEPSHILAGATHSLFTQHLLAGLRGGIPSDDGLIRVFDLFEYIQPHVTGDHPRQHPIFKADLRNNFPVALRLAGQAKAAARDDEGYVYDAYLSFVDQEPDAKWVWETLVPALEAVNLRIAISGVVQELGVALVIGTERALRQSKRTILVLSPRYLADNLVDFENVLAQTMGWMF